MLQTSVNEREELDVYNHLLPQTTVTPTHDSTEEFNVQKVNQTIFKLTKEKHAEIEAINTKAQTIQNASSLREIDEVLGIN